MNSILRNASKEMLQRVFLRDAFLWRLPPADAGRAALTFDDGPDPVFTPRLLRVLEQERVQATFFLLGSSVERHPDLAREIVARGHTVAGHSFSHAEIPTLSAAAIADELSRTREVIRAATGVDSVLFRPPRGRTDLRSLRAVTRLGYRVVHWSRTYSDYRADGTETLLGRMRAEPVVSRDIVLLHDNNEATVEAVPTLVASSRGAGLELVPLPPAAA
jgi:peptidoglycan/xylan/chitin deacetylase (PgdA/CDA1 family)